MKSTRIVGSGVVVGAIVLTIAALAYANAQGSVAGQAAASTPRGAAVGSRLEVEAEIAQTGLLGRVEAALGDAFAGVWFEGATRQLHVGVISAAARQKVEAVATEVGLSGHTTATPVDSTWAQLQAAQEAWSRRLADLLARAEVSTALRARYNAVEVVLGSAVPSAERADLEREAAASGVDVSIAAAPGQYLRLQHDVGRCRAFEEKKAYCDPTIVAGVRLENQKAEGCTAGPAAFPQDHTVPTDTYILTAGHCIDPKEGGEGNGGKWYAYPKAATKEADRIEVGKAVDFINGEKGDVGFVKVENTKWMQAGFTPVDPTVAQWTGAESEPVAVTAQQEPAEGLESCMSGQSSGTSCGEILKLGVEFLGSKGLVEVEASRKGGDSGAPWYSKGSPSIMEGTHVGGNATKAYFEPLATTFKELSPKLQLLTENNKVRHAFKFEAEAVPATLTGKLDGSLVVKTTAGVMECKESSFTGSQTEKAKVEFELTPTYAGCTALGLTGTVDMNECKYRFTATKIEALTKREGSMDIICPAGKEITITATAGEVNKCTIHVPPQSGLRTITYTNVGAGAAREITIDVNLTTIAYAHTAGTGIGKCTTGAAENGTMETTISVKAEDAGGKQVGFFSP